MSLKNRSADDYCHAQIPKMQSMIEPLNQFGISHFAYSKVVGQDKHMVFCPFHPLYREKFGYALDLDCVVQLQLNAFQSNNKYLLFQSCSGSDNPLVGLLREQNLNHWIGFLRKRGEGIYEAFHFASNHENEQILNFYINNLPLLNGFIDYFQESMAEYTDHTVPGRLIQLKTPAIITSSSPSSLNPVPFISGISKRKQLKSQKIVFNNNQYQLTQKEYECYLLLKKGYSSKEIARFLGKSYRTIDHQTALILEKLNLASRRDLFIRNLMN